MKRVQSAPLRSPEIHPVEKGILKVWVFPVEVIENPVPLVPIANIWEELLSQLSCDILVPVRYPWVAWFHQEKALFQLFIEPVQIQKEGELEKKGSLSELIPQRLTIQFISPGAQSGSSVWFGLKGPAAKTILNEKNPTNTIGSINTFFMNIKICWFKDTIVKRFFILYREGLIYNRQDKFWLDNYSEMMKNINNSQSFHMKKEVLFTEFFFFVYFLLEIFSNLYAYESKPSWIPVSQSRKKNTRRRNKKCW